MAQAGRRLPPRSFSPHQNGVVAPFAGPGVACGSHALWPYRVWHRASSSRDPASISHRTESRLRSSTQILRAICRERVVRESDRTCSSVKRPRARRRMVFSRACRHSSSLGRALQALPRNSNKGNNKQTTRRGHRHRFPTGQLQPGPPSTEHRSSLKADMSSRLAPSSQDGPALSRARLKRFSASP